MDYPIVLTRPAPRRIAAASGSLAPSEALGPLIIQLLDQVWPTLRGQGVTTGHNVVIYYAGSPLRLAAGVEVPDGFEPTDQVKPVSTPEGEIITTTYWGDYSGMRPAYVALENWCSENNRKHGGVSWEVYGDTHPDPARVRTDIYILLA